MMSRTGGVGASADLSAVSVLVSSGVRLRKSCDRACRRSARRLAATTPVPVLSHAGFLSGWRGLAPGAEVFPARGPGQESFQCLTGERLSAVAAAFVEVGSEVGEG